MSTIKTFSSAHVAPLASTFFMARRPILDARQHLAAHELFFSNGVGAAVPPDRKTIVADVVQHGLARIIGGVRAYIPVDGATLMSALMDSVPPERVVLSLEKTTQAVPELIERIGSLAQRGFVFAVDAATDLEQMKKLLPFARIVRVDIKGRAPDKLQNLCQLLKAHRKILLAESVDTVAQFEQCAGFGFDYFQGGFFIKPQVLHGKALTPSRQAVSELIALIESDADDAAIEHSIKSNVAIGLHLLRLANMPAKSTRRIDSLRQAQMVVGRNQLQRWLQVMLREEAGNDAHRMMPLLMLAALRGRLLEMIAYKLVPGNRGVADTAFMVGIMSLMDIVFCTPMKDLVQQIPVSDEVSDALLNRSGYFGRLLLLAEHTEWTGQDSSALEQMLHHLRLSHNDLYLLQLAAFEWSDQVSRNLH